MKKIELETTPEKYDMPVNTLKGSKPKKYYPSFYIDNKPLPLKGEDVGKEFTATVTLKLKGLQDNTNTNDSGKKRQLDYRFDVIDIAFDTDNGHNSADPQIDRKMKM